METNRKKTYPSQQLICALDAVALKVLMWFIGWQSKPQIKIYVGQMSKFLHLTEDEVELGIQTLINAKLLSVKQDNGYVAELDCEQIQKYFSIPMEKIKEGNGIALAEKATWNKEEKKESSSDIDDMSEQDLKRLLLRIEASLAEKQQVKKIVASQDNDEINDLPF